MVAPRRPALLRQRETGRRSLLLLASPAILWFSVLLLWPMLNMFFLSLTRWNSILDSPDYIGPRNFTALLADPRFHTAALNTAIYLAIGLAAVIPTAFTFGFYLSLGRWSHRILLPIFFSPAISSVTAKSMMFVGLYVPNGLLNSVLREVGLGRLTRLWLGDPSTALMSVIAVDIWTGIGFYSVLFFAALRGGSQELYDAARVDGASTLTVMLRIALPLSRDVIGVAILLHFLWILFGSAANVLLITGGGPGDYSLTLGYYMYEQAFIAHRIGYSQAIAVVLFVIGLLGALLIRSTTRGNVSDT